MIHHNNCLRSHAPTKVSFDDVLTVRLYNTVLGDHPSAIDGPPVSIGWNFITEKSPIKDVDDDSWIDDFSGGNRHRGDFYLDAQKRIERLTSVGVTAEEIENAVAEAKRIHELRKVHTIQKTSLPRTSSTGLFRRTTSAAIVVSAALILRIFPSGESTGDHLRGQRGNYNFVYEEHNDASIGVGISLSRF